MLKLKKYHLALTLLLTSLSQVGFAHYPIIITLAHPRSLSTALERMMRERNDLRVYHEPFTYLYYLKHDPTSEDVDLFEKGLPTSYPQLKKKLIAESIQGPVFVKDMAFAAYDELVKDEEFTSQSNVHIILQKRHPIKSLASLYKIEPQADFSFTGYEALKKIKDEFKLSLSIDADDLEDDPSEVYKIICQKTGLSFSSPLQNFKKDTPKEWQGKWYEKIRNSNRIEKSNKDYPTDNRGLPLFLEIPPRDRSQWLHYYARAKEIYDAL